ncbi:Cytochrome P450 monooxygenase aclL [Lachnellula suecica]|uniref:Cytochrome P450 monooxygenase aclL n=1 Tax=Lachnellula suecica TaxID=602035 RepID=A0A8T9CHG4_9HELO|nr:Cytochrome P450 monooxygenase aclL [Lachnellula suecica]
MNGYETFLKTDLMDFGAGDLGLIWESDPIKRKAVAKKILPAFSTKSLKAMEPIMHEYMDLFVTKMKQFGGKPDGLLMNDWVLWLATDMSADLAYNLEMQQMRDGKPSDLVTTLCGTSFVAMLMQLSKKLPLIALATPFFIPFKVLRKVPATLKTNSAQVKRRIDSRGKTRHPDFMDYMIHADGPPPSSKTDLIHMEQVALQLFIAGFDPVQIVLYASMFFLVKYPSTCATLTKEIRESFQIYEEMKPDSLGRLKYLNAFISEVFRVHLTVGTGMPRISPGATVDGVYVPTGVVCQVSSFTAMRSERYFRDPLEFHPARWLPQDHSLYDIKYADDNLKAFYPFGVGPRMCTGREIAWSQIRLFLGKVLWSFDLEAVSGHEKSFNRDFRVFVMWERPELYVRFLPARG